MGYAPPYWAALTLRDSFPERESINLMYYLFFFIQIVYIDSMCILYMEHEIPGSREIFLTLATPQANSPSFRYGHITLYNMDKCF